MKTIELTRGKVAFVDDCDYPSLMENRWTTLQARNRFYAISAGRKGRELMHRRITGARSGQEVDHINGDGLDNRRSNLRLCTRAQNSWNSKSKLSDMKGVHRTKGSKPWVALIRVNGKRHYLGNFLTKIEGARAYNDAAKKYYGDFAYLNQIPL